MLIHQLEDKRNDIEDKLICNKFALTLYHFIYGWVAQRRGPLTVNQVRRNTDGSSPSPPTKASIVIKTDGTAINKKLNYI